MSYGHVRQGADLRLHAMYSRPNHGVVASEDGEFTNVLLREALAREAALRRERDELIRKLLTWRAFAADRVARLSPRQRQIMELVVAGHPSKNIAADLGISQRTVENHRAEIMKRTGSKSLPALARFAFAFAFAVAWDGAVERGPDFPKLTHFLESGSA
jgi:DNA-binding NarL/FixJ family response regulator